MVCIDLRIGYSAFGLVLLGLMINDRLAEMAKLVGIIAEHRRSEPAQPRLSNQMDHNVSSPRIGSPVIFTTNDIRLACEYCRSLVLMLLTTALGSVTFCGSGTMTAAVAGAAAAFHVMVETGVWGGVGCAVCTTVSCRGVIVRFELNPILANLSKIQLQI